MTTNAEYVRHLLRLRRAATARPSGKIYQRRDKHVKEER
jgi:hypothetical protein